MPVPGPEGDLLGGPGGVGADGMTPMGGGPKPPEDFSGVEQGGVAMDPMESVMEPLQFDYNSQMPMDNAPTVGLFDYANQQQVRATGDDLCIKIRHLLFIRPVCRGENHRKLHPFPVNAASGTGKRHHRVHITIFSLVPRCQCDHLHDIQGLFTCRSCLCSCSRETTH